MVSLCSPGCLRTCSVDQPDLEFRVFGLCLTNADYMHQHTSQGFMEPDSCQFHLAIKKRDLMMEKIQGIHSYPPGRELRTFRMQSQSALKLGHELKPVFCQRADVSVFKPASCL